MPTTQDIVQKLWNLCHILRDDGITYHQYVTELTFLLFLKMMKETGAEEQIPKGYRWDDLTKKDGVELLDFYKKLLIDLGSSKKGGSGRVQAIFANASTSFRQPRHMRTVVENIDALDWYSAKSEGLGDLYEGLLEKNAEETKSGAGQYFTPRPLIESMVALIKPQPGELVQDPAVGTGGFLINADRYVRSLTDGYHDLPVAKQNFQRREAFYGVELVPDVQRLALMNAMLHDIEGDIVLGDTLGPTGAQLPKANVILTNPPFGTKKGGGGPTRDDITYPTSNKQLVFLQHIYRGLKPGGRAAVVLPDNVLFEEGVGPEGARGPHGQVRPPHDPAPAHGHLLRAGREDERALLHARREGQGEHEGRLVLRHADEHALVRQADAVHPGALRGVREGVRRGSAGQEQAEGPGGGGAVPQVHAGGDCEARRQPRHLVAEGRERDRPRGPAGAGRIAAEIVAQLQTALEEMEALQEELGSEA